MHTRESTFLQPSAMALTLVIFLVPISACNRHKSNTGDQSSATVGTDTTIATSTNGCATAIGRVIMAFAPQALQTCTAVNFERTYIGTPVSSDATIDVLANDVSVKLYSDPDCKIALPDGKVTIISGATKTTIYGSVQQRDYGMKFSDPTGCLEGGGVGGILPAAPSSPGP